MLTDMPIFKVYGAMARHAAESHRVSAENIANAAVPGYQARAVEPFESYLARLGREPAGQGPHLISSATGDASAPNGNTVNLEQEMFRSAEAVGQHSMAMSVYSKSLDLMRSALGRSR